MCLYKARMHYFFQELARIKEQLLPNCMLICSNLWVLYTCTEFVLTPFVYIPFLQKCGTTSMYEYLCQHPLVVRGKRRETHYFDWRYNNTIAASDAAAHLKYYMNFYHAEALEKHISLITGESTPSYLLHRYSNGVCVVMPCLRFGSTSLEFVVRVLSIC